MTFYKDAEEKITAQIDDGTVTINLAESLEEEHGAVINSDVGIELQTNLYENIFVPAALMKTRGIKVPGFSQCTDDGSGSAGIYTYAFQSSQEEELFGGLVISRKWVPTTNIIPVVFWTPSANGSSGQKVKWGFEYVLPSLTDRLVGNSTILTGYNHTPDETLLEGKVYSTTLSQIVPPSNPFNCIEFRIFRDADSSDDTYGSDAYLGAVGLFVEVNRIGCPADEI